MHPRFSPPGLFPYVVLGAWAFVALALFLVLRPRKAAVVVMLAGTLFLPERTEFDLPLVPPLGKHEISALCAALGLWLFGRGALGRARPGRGLDLLVLALVASAVPLALTNRAPIFTGAAMLPGLGGKDMLAEGIRALVTIGLPFLVGRAACESGDDMRTLYRLLLKFGLVYALFMLFEVRMSPQLHNWIYGFHAHDFVQTMRWGGYRPTVFLEHGLAVGLFALVVAAAACVHARNRRLLFFLPSWVWVAFFLVVVVLCKSTGAIVLGVFLLPVAIFLGPKNQVRVALLVAVVCLAYPAVKASGLFPEEALVELATRYTGAERAVSLSDRFDNDRMLLDHAREKSWFGWGGYSRSHVFDESGRDISVLDGFWIIQYGARGIVGLGCVFGLMLFPIFALPGAMKRIRDRRDRALLAGLALLIALHVLDLLPNGLFTRIPLFLAGALARLSRELPREAPEEDLDEDEVAPLPGGAPVG